MCFDGEKARDEYPVSYYEELLSYVRDKYGDTFWSALPRDAARLYCANAPPTSRNSRKKICMVTHSHYEGDNRVRRYAEALVRRGDLVDVIAIAGETGSLGAEDLNGVTVHRVQYRERNERNKWDYAYRLLRFFVKSSIFITSRHHRTRYDLIHVHNVPDFLVFSAWYPKLTGVKIILDIHDIVPEFFASKFRTQAGSRYVELLKKVEKAAASFADHVIVSNDLWREKLISRSMSKEKSSVFLNHVDPSLFYARTKSRKDEKVIILFHGSSNWHQGLDIAIDAFAQLKNSVPNAEFHIYGDGDKSELIQRVDHLGVNGVKFCGRVPLDQIPNIVANADLGVVPKRANSFGNEAYSTKIMEFMSQGVPVVVSRTKIDSFYFDDTVVRFFTPGDAGAMAEAMREVIHDTAQREALIKGGYEYVDRHSWDVRRVDYFGLVDALSIQKFNNSRVSLTKVVADV
jgi:glycosyltransferase involved in cell wall biosynthesis